MGSVPDMGTFLRKPRVGPSHKVRPVMKLEWNKLLAEATEKDFEVEKDTVDGEDYYDDETDDVQTQENVEGNVRDLNQDERPLNLCNQSHTMPMSSSQFPNSFGVLDLSARKKKPDSKPGRKSRENEKSNTCPIQNFTLDENAQNNVTRVDNKEDIADSENKENCPSNINNSNHNNNNNVKNDQDIFSTPVNKKTNSQEIYCNIITSSEKIKSSNQNSEKKNLTYFNEKKNSSKISIDKGKNPKEDLIKKFDADKKENLNHKGKPKSNLETPVSKKSVHVATPLFEKFAVPAAPKPKESQKMLTINGKNYQILAPLGKGGSSKVYLVLNTENELLAVKCVRLSDVSESTKNDYLNEIQHLMKMQHCQHVIRLYDHQYLSSQKILLAVMERGETDLSRFLKNKASSDEGISPELIMYYWTEMLLAVKSIHDNNIIHRDLKPANFLLVSGRLKLIDFGIASSIQTEQTSIFMETQSGTFNYMSPEALQDLGFENKILLKIGRKTDVWSLGCILYYFLYKKTPYQDLVKPIQKLKAITDPNYVVPFPKIPGVPDILIDSCKRCLVHDTKKRASIDELLAFRNRPLLSLSQVLGKLEGILSSEEYGKAKKAFEDACTNHV